MTRALSRPMCRHDYHPTIPRNTSARSYAAWSTAMSESDASAPHSSSAYHPVKQAPHHIIERILILLEEGLFSAAIANINTVLFSGISDTPPQAGLTVPPSFLRFLTTLIVHPFYTTQVRTKASTQKGPEDAHILIRRIIQIVGPISSDLSDAWVFSGSSSGGGSRAGRKRAAVHLDDDGSPNARDDYRIHSPLASEESLFQVAEDLWSVVGWAFNCSVLHPRRWRCWRNVLDVFLLALEVDWNIRGERFKDEQDEDKKDSHLNGALILKMLPDTTGTAGCRKIVRAIFADGRDSAEKEFRELWPDELKRRRDKRIPGRREIGQTIASDDGEETESEAEGSGLSDDEQEFLEEKEDVEGDSIMVDKTPKTVNIVDKWGGVEAVEMRQRFLVLISSVCYFGKFMDLDKLYNEYKDMIRQFPISSFILFVSTYLDAYTSYRVGLVRTVMDTLITSTAPFKKMYGQDITLESFTKAYLPYNAANTTLADNAKLAVCFEVLARIMTAEKIFVWSQELEDAVETGIAARRKHGTKMKAGQDKAEILAAWDGADRQLRLLVKLAEMRKHKPVVVDLVE